MGDKGMLSDVDLDRKKNIMLDAITRSSFSIERRDAAISKINNLTGMKKQTSNFATYKHIRAQIKKGQNANVDAVDMILVWAHKGNWGLLDKLELDDPAETLLATLKTQTLGIKFKDLKNAGVANQGANPNAPVNVDSDSEDDDEIKDDERDVKTFQDALRELRRWVIDAEGVDAGEEEEIHQALCEMAGAFKNVVRTQGECKTITSESQKAFSDLLSKRDEFFVERYYLMENKLADARDKVTDLEKTTEDAILQKNVAWMESDAHFMNMENTIRDLKSIRDATKHDHMCAVVKTAERAYDTSATNARVQYLEASLTKILLDNREVIKASVTAASDNNKLKTENAALKSNVEPLNQKIADLKAIHTDYITENGDLQTKIRSLQKEIKELKADDFHVSAENAGLKSDNAGHRSKNANLTSDITRLNKQIKDLNNAALLSKNAVGSVEADNARLQTENAALKSQIEALNDATQLPHKKPKGNGDDTGIGG